MPTLIDIDSFQHRILRLANAGAGLWYTVSVGEGSTAPCHDGVRITFDPTNARTADHAVALKVVHSATTGQATQIRRVMTGIPGLSNTPVGSFYFKCDTPPTTAHDNMYQSGASTNGLIGVNTDGTLRARVGAGTVQSSTTNICDGQWHLIDYRYDTSTTTGKLDVQIDGTENVTQATGTVTVGNMDSWNFGGTSIAPAAYTAWYSDFVLSGTSADYPIGHHICKLLAVNATGTHSQGAGAFTDQAGGTSDAALLAAVDDAWDGTTPNLTQTGEDYVQQTANDAAGYVEFGLEDPADSTIWDVLMDALMAAEDATTACNGSAQLFHSGTQRATTGLVDPSVSATAYAGYHTMASRPTGDWDGTKLGAALMRFGFSTDAAPDVAFNAGAVEYAAPWSAAAGSLVVPQRSARNVNLRR